MSDLITALRLKWQELSTDSLQTSAESLSIGMAAVFKPQRGTGLSIIHSFVTQDVLDVIGVIIKLLELIFSGNICGFTLGYKKTFPYDYEHIIINNNE